MNGRPDYAGHWPSFVKLVFFYACMLHSEVRLSTIKNDRSSKPCFCRPHRIHYPYLSLEQRIHIQPLTSVVGFGDFTGRRHLTHILRRHSSHNSPFRNNHQNSAPHRAHLSSRSGTTNSFRASTSDCSCLEWGKTNKQISVQLELVFSKFHHENSQTIWPSLSHKSFSKIIFTISNN